MNRLGLTRVAYACAAAADIPVRQRPFIEGEGADRHVRLTSRRIPRRVLAGGYLFWIIRHTLVARQQLLGVAEEATPDGQLAILRLHPHVEAIVPMHCRAHQGWRYIAEADWPQIAPAGDAMPSTLAAELATLALL